MEPSGFMMASLAKYLAKNDKYVSVICGYPNFPQGKFIDKKWYEISRIHKQNKVHVHNVFVIPSNNTNNFKRIINYTSYMLSSFIKGIIISRPDVIVSTTPPIFTALSALFVAKLRKVQLILDVRDIWPESAIQMGRINNNFIIKFLEYIENSLYRNADQIVVATPGMIDLLEIKGVDRRKIQFIPCGVEINEKLESSIEVKNPYMKRDQSKFIVLYAGLHGFAQGLDVIIEVAECLKNNNNIVFYFLGDGPEKTQLINTFEKKELDNIRFLEPVSKKDIKNYFLHTGCALVPLKNLAIFNNVYPSKTFELMSFGVPTIVGVNGEISKLINSTMSGISVAAENIYEYQNAIISLSQDDQLRNKISANARILAKDEFNYKYLNQKYSNIIEGLHS